MPQSSSPRRRRASVGIVAGVAVSLLAPLAASSVASTAAAYGAPPPLRRAAPTTVCPAPTTPLRARCLTVLRGTASRSAVAATTSVPPATAGERSAAAAVPSPYLGATDLQKAYRLTRLLTTRGRGQTIAIVDAYGYTAAEKDLGVYRAKYGIRACTVANGCFRQVDQRGTNTPAPAPPSGFEGWQLETALDLDMVSAACPLCTILLVEADTASLLDLGTSVDTAVKLGADVVSNSYGAPEQGGLDPYFHYWQHPGVPVVVSSGDSGFGDASFPAVLPSSVAVGGTTMTHASNYRGFREVAWSEAGSACSAFFAKPSWQPGTHCSMRLSADVSAAADNLIIYNSSVIGGYAVVAGTSASAPFIAGVIGLAGNADSYTAKYSYAHSTRLFDVVGGTNAQPFKQCGTDYLCNAVRGYDGPTGVGTPKGIGGF